MCLEWLHNKGEPDGGVLPSPDSPDLQKAQKQHSQGKPDSRNPFINQ